MSRFVFGARSRRHLATVEPALVRVAERALALDLVDFAVIQGHRGREAQDRAFRGGKSRARWGGSPHNRSPACAIDVVPWHPEAPHVRWNDRAAFVQLAAVLFGAAALEGVPIRWGGDWDRDGIRADGPDWDLGHFELAAWSGRGRVR